MTGYPIYAGNSPRSFDCLSRLTANGGVNPVQVFGRIKFNLDSAFVVGLLDDPYTGTERVLHFLNRRFDVGIQLNLIDVLWAAALQHLSGHALHLAYRPALSD